MRAKSNKIRVLPVEIAQLTGNLTSGYHRDFQLLKGVIMDAIDVTKDNLEVWHFMLEHIQVNQDILDNPIYDYMYSVEELNRMVMDGMTFRDAYKALGQQILAGDFRPKKSLSHTHEGSIGNLCLKEIRDKFERSMRV